MKLKKLAHYRMNFEGKAVVASGLMMGIAMFLRVLYFLGFRFVGDIATGELILGLILPLVFGIAYVALLRGIRLNAPGVYGIFGAVYGILAIVWGFQDGSTLYIVLNFVWYILASVVLLGTVGGFIPRRIFAAVMYLLPFLFRILVMDLKKYILAKAFAAFLPEAALLAGVLSFFFLALSLKNEKK